MMMVCSYSRAIEMQVHELQALMGVILSSSNPGVRSCINDLAGDPFACTILARVDESPFGPERRRQRASEPGKNTFANLEGMTSEAMYDNENREGCKATLSLNSSRRSHVRTSSGAETVAGNPFIVGPTNRWQEYVLAKVLGVNEPQVNPNLRNIHLHPSVQYTTTLAQNELV